MEGVVAVSKSLVVFGAGPALGRAVAHRYAREGYSTALVARRAQPLKELAGELTSMGGIAYPIAFDLSDTDAVPRLAEQIRHDIGDPDTIYYGPSGRGASPAPSALIPGDLQPFMGIALYTLVALVHEFLPSMIEQSKGAVLVATGASAIQGTPGFSVAGPALAAQRNYLQSLELEMNGRGVYVGRLYIGATIRHSAWHARLEAEEKAGRPARARGPLVDPAQLADLLWSMHHVTKKPESLSPEHIFDR